MVSNKIKPEKLELLKAKLVLIAAQIAWEMAHSNKKQS
jgi:hypothetical protein